MARRWLGRDGGAFGIWWFWHAVLGMLVVVVVVIAVAVSVKQSAETARASVEAAKYVPPTAAAGVPIESVTIKPIPKGSRVLIFGDSWVAGQSASPQTRGFAYLLGASEKWDATVDGVPTTGFNNAGQANQGTYIQRIDKLPSDKSYDAVIVEGGINDEYTDHAGYAGTVATALKALEAKYPKAQMVLLGPGAYQLPVSARLKETDSILSATASGLRIAYISPLAHGWTTTANFSSVIDSETSHPSTAGHAYWASKVKSALAMLTR